MIPTLLVGLRQLAETMGKDTLPERALASLERAQIMVQAAIDGELTERVIVGDRYKLLYDKTQEYGIQTRFGPIASVQAMVVNEAEVDIEDLIVGTWTIKRLNGFRRNSIVTIDYTVGYHRHGEDTAGVVVEGGNVPPEIVQAILLPAAEIYLHPDPTLTSERIGDYTYTLRGINKTDEEYSLPPRSLTLIRRYCRPRV